MIAARGGSQGVPGKNLRPLLGRPLVARAIDTARAVPEIGRVLVSTDSAAIADVARAAGADVPFMRPADLSRSDTGKFLVWRHALEAIESKLGVRCELYVDLDCTNPLIEPTDVSAAIDRFRAARRSGRPVDAIFTVARARRNPYFNLVEPDRAGALRMSKHAAHAVVARQQAPVVFEHVAGVYVLDPAYLRRASHLLDGHAEGYEVPDDKAFDVDSELDFQIIEFLLSRREALASRKGASA